MAMPDVAGLCVPHQNNMADLITTIVQLKTYQGSGMIVMKHAAFRMMKTKTESPMIADLSALGMRAW